MTTLPFFEVDVFSTGPFTGNPLGVVVEADHLSSEQMQSIASWTNFSETTFLLSPTEPTADYRVRIFTPVGELPFAGHPTLGTAKVWQETGGEPKQSDVIRQQCGVGIVEIRTGKINAFATPALLKDGPFSDEELTQIAHFLEIDPSSIVAHSWGDNGPGWAVVQLENAAAVKALTPSGRAPLKIGVVGLHEDPCGNPEHAYEVRAFFDTFEDPVTGSLNGSVAQWMRSRGLVPSRYTATQGSARGRNGVISIHDDGENIWIGGSVRVCVKGEIKVS